MMRLNQERIMIQYNEIREEIEKEKEIDRLRNFQFWYQQIVNSDIPETLQNQLHEKRRQRFEELEYIRKYNNNKKYELQTLRSERLKELSNKYYEEIEKEIPMINDDILLSDGGRFDNRI
ncbi:hypothetical protein F8M41_022032 [Gigaspora margarita]|uniref:Uncharacterized protein n=1 Tax=Gigaspora margarita TaxID=4874 RepID=A0A8H4EIH2_GIGMA|nr:hypothetical protein F8M41_022032 [Gigaspora margarita]